MAKNLADGSTVNMQSKRSLQKVGRVADIRDSEKGQWVDVNVGDKKNPVIRTYRPSELTVA